jgi:hypothetical protein
LHFHMNFGIFFSMKMSLMVDGSCPESGDYFWQYDHF